MSDINVVSQLINQAPEGLSDDFKESIKIANELREKMKIN